MDCVDDDSAIKSASHVVDSHDVELLANGSACSQVRRPVKTDIQKISAGDELTRMAMLRWSHGMSAWGQKRRFIDVHVTSALLLIADIRREERQVRLVPEAEVISPRQNRMPNGRPRCGRFCWLQNMTIQRCSRASTSLER